MFFKQPATSGILPLMPNLQNLNHQTEPMTKEIKSILEAYAEARQSRKKAALVSLVHVEGSSYRRPGARMLVTEDGQMTGAISGGCLEGDALRKALQVLNQQQSRLVTYDTTDEDDATMGVQLGCAGIIQVLIEPIDDLAELNPISLLEQAGRKRQSVVLVTCFNLADKKAVQTGTCMLVEENKASRGRISDSGLQEKLLDAAKAALTEKKSAIATYNIHDQPMTAFIEYVLPPVSLVIIGAGNDVLPLVALAETLGWEITVIDGRPALASKDRFSASCQVLVARPEKVLEQVNIDPQTVFVLMTHNYNYDLAMLKALVDTPVPYIGVLGPKRKLERMLTEIEQGGTALSPGQLSRVYGPMGLDLGAETAEEIALSICAEIKAVLSGKNGRFLRELANPIHSPYHIQMPRK